jgi:catechol 2,3-dioxygenase
MGRVDLTVADAERERRFYEEVVGLPSGQGLVGFHEAPDASAPDPRATGLFHLAIVVPTRRDLALALVRLARARWPLTGASDHLVSEALYLADPEGNGIELYRDRPREEWRRSAGGELEMATLPLDLQDLVRELDGPDGEDASAPSGTRMGHVHLNVADIAASEAFYNGALGFDVTVRSYPGALFVSAGDYHHHVGLTTWAGEGAPPPPPGARGLRQFDVELPSAADVDAAADRLEAAGAEPLREDGAVLVADPSGNRVRLTARS